MKHFSGFPARMQFTPIPNLLFSSLLPQIDDIAELKTTLHIFEALYRKRGYPRFVTRHEMEGNPGLLSSLRGGDSPPAEVMRHALETAARRGTILHIALDNGGRASEDVYFINTAQNRDIVEKVRQGTLNLSGLKGRGQPVADMEIEEPPDIFTLYEQNVGMLTPIIADELRQAEGLYPDGWIQDAIKEAIAHNKRNWRYTQAILERWAVEGRDIGTHRRGIKTDPDRYVKGKYGGMVKR